MLSVVVPCYNEESVLERMAEVLTEVLPGISPDHEVIFVDDGSKDRTLEILREVCARHERFQFVALSRNFGKEGAMLAGLSHAQGTRVGILDADLQHPPTLLADMLPLLDEGYDQVVARRTRTGDAKVRTAVSRLYYNLFNRLIDIKLQDGVGDFRVLSRAAVDALLRLQESNRFSKGLFSWIGFRTTVVDYENVARTAGDTKWRMTDLLNYGIDGVLSFNTKPLRVAIHVGVFVSTVAFAYALWVLGRAVLYGVEAPGYVTIICTVVGFGGMQMILLGVIGEYLGRIYLETKRRPHFLVMETSTGVGPDLTQRAPGQDR